MFMVSHELNNQHHHYYKSIIIIIINISSSSSQLASYHSQLTDKTSGFYPDTWRGGEYKNGGET